MKIAVLISFWSYMIVTKIFKLHRECKSPYNPTTLEIRTAGSTPSLTNYKYSVLTKGTSHWPHWSLNSSFLLNSMNWNPCSSYIKTMPLDNCIVFHCRNITWFTYSVPYCQTLRLSQLFVFPFTSSAAVNSFINVFAAFILLFLSSKFLV